MVDHLPRLPGLGHRLHADRRRRGAAGRRDPGRARRGGPGRGVHRRARRGRARAARGRPARQRAQGAGRDVGAGDGLRQARPRLRRARRLAAVAGLVLPAGRPRRARHRPRAGRCCCRPTPTRGCGTTSRPRRSRCPSRSSGCWPGWRRTAPISRHRVPALEAETGLRRDAGRADAQAAGRRRRGRAGRGRLAAHGRAWTYDAEHYDGIVAVRRREADIMRAYTRGERCLMQLLQESLDDPTAEPCGRCSVCPGGLPPPLERRAVPRDGRARCRPAAARRDARRSSRARCGPVERSAAAGGSRPT